MMLMKMICYGKPGQTAETDLRMLAFTKNFLIFFSYLFLPFYGESRNWRHSVINQFVRQQNLLDILQHQQLRITT